MLIFDPEKRITVQDALAHPYMKNLHYEEDEPIGDKVPAFDFDFELFSLKTNEYKDLLYKEILLYHDQEIVDKYISDKKTSPNGILNQTYAKDRLRTMYKQDKQIHKLISRKQ